ncbi:MAG: flagellar M-ring protein FliF [Porticoccus sp.]|nr:flagellar M-ring protein FliF [Porticoccus sp.]MBQ0807731.1 flagellar M-ring protein FliF [Porticoccus sp.]
MSDLAAASIDIEQDLAQRQQLPVPALDQVKTWIGGNSLTPLLIAGASVIALIAALLMWAGSPEYRVLYSNLSEADGGRIINALDQQSVPYSFSESGNTILVPADKVHVLRLQLAEQGLPLGGGVGFELMDKQAFGISQFAEQINFQRGLEGELVQSIKALGPVADARIHLALAKRSVFVRNSEPAKASVLATLHPGRTLDPGQVNAIIHLVSSSVPNLTFDNITVVDQAGNLLSGSAELNKSLGNTQLNHTQEVESNYQERIENILSPLFGKENIRVQVTAQINFSKREETVEHYAPNQNTQQAAVRSAQWSTNVDGGTRPSGGVPGALSNSPPSWGSASAESDKKSGEAEAEIQGQGQQNAANNFQGDNTINYEVDRNITHIQHQSSQVERLSSAVVVNYQQNVDKKGKLTQTPLTEDELEQVTLLVKQAIGFSFERGDEVQVVNSPFTKIVVAKQEELTFWAKPQGQELILILARYLPIGLAALVLYFLIIRPLLKRHLTQAPSSVRPEKIGPAATGVPGDETDEESGVDVQLAPRKSSAGRRIKAQSYEQNVHELRQVAKEDPRLFAMIVRSWVTKK